MSKKNDAKKMISVMLTPELHKRAKVLAELSGTSLSDLVEEVVARTVKSRLPGLLVGLTGTAEPTPAE